MDMEFFDAYVGSILDYGCEVLGSDMGPDIKRVHLRFLKRELGVKRTTNNMMVYTESD